MAEQSLAAEVEALRQRVAELEEENRQLHEEKVRLNDEVDHLRSRCDKLARAASAQSEPEHDAAAEGRLPSMLQQMLRHPKDEAVQLKGIEALFAQQAHIDGAGASNGNSASTAQASLEAACALFSNFPGNRTLLLKASQLMSLLLSEPDAQQRLPVSTLLQATDRVLGCGSRLLSSMAAGEAEQPEAKQPPASKLLTWFIALLEKLFPLLGSHFREKSKGEALLQRFLSEVLGTVLSSLDTSLDSLVLKCVQLLPLLPMEPWLQKACLDCGVVHSMALTYQRCAAAGADAALPQALQLALRGIFAQNLEVCIVAIEDKFVNDEFVCMQVLDELKEMEKKQRGTFRKADSELGLLSKAMGLWSFHQRRALEDSKPDKSSAKEVLIKVADVVTAVLLKLPPQVLLQRMQELQSSEVFQRLSLAAIHENAQLRLQVAVAYADNGVVPVLVQSTQVFLHNAAEEVQAGFRLLQNEKLPAERWPYISYCLELCKHILSHWSATRLSIVGQADTSALDARGAPLLLAQGGLVDVLAELIEPTIAGDELKKAPPANLQMQASDTLHALFEQNGHICLFCLQHYSEVKEMVSLGCESLALNPLVEFPELQQQAVEHLTTLFEKYANDERMSRKILKGLSILFESSYRLVAWFLNAHGWSTLSEYQTLDVHVAAMNAATRAPFWSYEDIVILPEFVGVVALLVLGAIEGLTDQPLAKPSAADAASAPRRRKPLELGEAEEVVSASTAALLHLLLIDPSPPTVLRSLSRALAGEAEAAPAAEAADASGLEADANAGSEKAVTVVMQIMQVFPSSDRLQLSCQHLLTQLLGE